MNYLFFDLEFATCRGGYHKICEFGFALTDSSFTVRERGTFLINPAIRRNEWDFFALRKIIKRKISDFTSEPTFDSFFPKIQALFEQADYAFGHSTFGDVQALHQDCKRFCLPALFYFYFDLSEFYKKVTESKDQRSLTAILEELSLTGEEGAHDAGTDAFNTMLCVRELLVRKDATALRRNPEAAFRSFLAAYSIQARQSSAVSAEPHRKIPRADRPKKDPSDSPIDRSTGNNE